jgi:hypothetical protein
VWSARSENCIPQRHDLTEWEGTRGMRQAHAALESETTVVDLPNLELIHRQQYHHEPAKQSRNMVRLKTRSSTIRPDADTLTLRSKRLRASSLQDRDQDHKRRKLANKVPPPLRIPLRARAPDLQPDSGPGAVTPPKSLDSPTAKPQYDQIRIIEEKARASIRDASSQPTTLEERRKLRSEHGGSRSKTELAQYFPFFEEMLSLDAPDPGRTRVESISKSPTDSFQKP